MARPMRRLDKVGLCALLIEATPFADHQMVAAMGISRCANS
jgi:hypothetical protein